MSIQRTEHFQYEFCAAGLVDIGKYRKSNQDEVILCPEYGFFAVSDGMGGLAEGGKTSNMIKQAMPLLIEFVCREYGAGATVERASQIFADQVKMVSDNLFDAVNTEGHFGFGATFSGVWFIDNKAVFVNLGDSRGYHLPYYRRNIVQVTEDHNVAAMLVHNGELTREEAKRHSSSSRLTRFVGMTPPALPEIFIREVSPGDRILLCSDGLHGMSDDTELVRTMRSSTSPRKVCQRLINAANQNGGRDNISAVYVKIME